ncbi:penicillin acylase family protein [bacterium]|nr:penicillin acylase family protein [bacterium]
MQTLTIRFIELMCCSCFITLIFSVVAYGQSEQQVTIYRDTYGVPHIYGDSEEAVAYGHGYAQAEDRLETLLKAYRKAEGTMAEAFGEEFVEP